MKVPVVTISGPTPLDQIYVMSDTGMPLWPKHGVRFALCVTCRGEDHIQHYGRTEERWSGDRQRERQEAAVKIVVAGIDAEHEDRRRLIAERVEAMHAQRADGAE